MVNVRQMSYYLQWYRETYGRVIENRIQTWNTTSSEFSDSTLKNPKKVRKFARTRTDPKMTLLNLQEIELSTSSHVNGNEAEVG